MNMERRELEGLKVEIEAARDADLADLDTELARIEARREEAMREYQRRLDAVDVLLAMPLRNGRPTNTEAPQTLEPVELSEIITLPESEEESAPAQPINEGRSSPRPEDYPTRSSWMRSIINELEGEISQTTLRKRLTEIAPDVAATIQTTSISKIFRLGEEEGALVKVADAYAKFPAVYRRVKPLSVYG
jgi:hypothetical protein